MKKYYWKMQFWVSSFLFAIVYLHLSLMNDLSFREHWQYTLVAFLIGLLVDIGIVIYKVKVRKGKPFFKIPETPGKFRLRQVLFSFLVILCMSGVVYLDQFLFIFHDEATMYEDIYLLVESAEDYYFDGLDEGDNFKLLDDQTFDNTRILTYSTKNMIAVFEYDKLFMTNKYYVKNFEIVDPKLPKHVIEGKSVWNDYKIKVTRYLDKISVEVSKGIGIWYYSLYQHIRLIIFACLPMLMTYFGRMLKFNEIHIAETVKSEDKTLGLDYE